MLSLHLSGFLSCGLGVIKSLNLKFGHADHLIPGLPVVPCWQLTYQLTSSFSQAIVKQVKEAADRRAIAHALVSHIASGSMTIVCEFISSEQSHQAHMIWKRTDHG